ncbi:MAG: FAD-dependent oxidoreductase, partial [Deltaproteobacteria bacterium]|nr:FAD-dependent oxidoreductase [Deltaproteobacteria bacterium]
MAQNTALAERFNDVEMFRTCEQCGCCSSACPISGKENFNIRRIIRFIELDLVDDIAAGPFPWMCTTCGRCETVCPNGIGILDIIRPLRAMAPEEYVPDGPPPCMHACPGGIDVPGYIRLIAEGKPREAHALILEKVPFPGILGRVCTHPCEDVCRRGEVNAPISICALKRYAADKSDGLPEEISRCARDTGRRIAVVGSGPAGLTAAFYLRKKGHQITVFEERSKPGGMMRYGIPSYRLPEDALDREINQVLDLGIELKTKKSLGRDFDLNQLKEQGYDAVFLALGLQESRKIDLEGAQSKDVLWGLDFLSQVSEGKDIALKDRVLVVGGGNVAVDVGLTALRKGAKEVTLACLESQEEMPANPWEIEMAREEGIRLMPSWGPKRILEEGGKVTGIELVQCASVFDDQGNFCPAFDDVTETVSADQVILAIGQTTDLTCLASDDTCRIEESLIAADPETQETDMPGVFAGGDVTKGPGIIIEAIAAGKRAAGSIDRYLGGDGVIESPGRQVADCKVENPDTPSYDGKREKGFADLQRVPIPTLPLEERYNGFPEVDLCLEDDQAQAEALRCLECDLEWCLAKEFK